MWGLLDVKIANVFCKCFSAMSKISSLALVHKLKNYIFLFPKFY